MSTESHVSQTRMNERAARFQPAGHKIELRLGRLRKQYAIAEHAGEADVSTRNGEHLETEYLLLTERIKALEAENAGLQMRVQFLQELCLMD